MGIARAQFAALAAILAPTIAMLGGGFHAIAQLGILEGAQRIVSEFTFEERAFNAEPVPRHWVRVVHAPPFREKPGYPSWNESEFDDTYARSGDYSVLIPAKGGSGALRLSGGVIAAIPGADYLVSVYIRTAGLEHARARLTARLLSDRLEYIDGSESSSELINAEEDWHRTQVTLYGDYTGAAWIQIDLELLQPIHQSNREKTAGELFLEDFDARAWFDDLTIIQLPRVRLSTNSDINIIEAPQRPEISARVRDLTGERLEVDMHILDIDGRTVAVRTFDADSRGGVIRWSPDLEQYGFHRVLLRVISDGREVAFDDLAFLWTPQLAQAHPEGAEAFGVSLHADRLKSITLAPEFLRAVGARSVHLPLWPESDEGADFTDRMGTLEPVLDELLDLDIDVTLRLIGAPPAIAAELRGDVESPFDLLDLPLERWSRYVDPALIRFGQRIKRWEPTPHGGRTFEVDEIDPSRVDAFGSMLAGLSPEPIVALPWHANSEAHPDLLASSQFTARVSPGTAPETIPVLLQEWLDDGAERTHFLLGRATSTLNADRWRVADLIKRAVFAQTGGEHTLLIEQPWRWRDSRRESPEILPELAAWRTAVSMLSGRTVVGRLPTTRGATAIVLDGDDGGMIVAWNDWANPEDATLQAYLGASSVAVVDAFGNESDAPPAPDGSHSIPLSPTPIFITGIEYRLALFQNGMRVQPGFVPSIAARHNLELVISNPFDSPITGRVRLAEPMRWDMTPRVQRFAIQPGEETRLSFSAMLGVAEEAGVRRLEAQVELTAEGSRSSFIVRPPIEVGLEEVSLTATARREGVGNEDVVVTLLVTNTTTEPITMHAFAVAHGHARQQAPVSRLLPGASTLRQFILRGAGDDMTLGNVRVGLVDVNGPLRLNKTVPVR